MNRYPGINDSAIYRSLYKRNVGKIPIFWVIHHVDGNHFNNDITNLVAMPRKLHSKMHARKELWPKEAIELFLKQFLDYYQTSYRGMFIKNKKHARRFRKSWDMDFTISSKGLIRLISTNPIYASPSRSKTSPPPPRVKPRVLKQLSDGSAVKRIAINDLNIQEYIKNLELRENKNMVLLLK